MNDAIQGSSYPARHWSRRDDGRIACGLCPRRCVLAEGQRGPCFGRGAAASGMVLATYGRSSGFCIDPIEKKPLHHFLPGTPILSFGTAGCNLACTFCQNWEISRARDADRLVDVATPEAIAAAAAALGCRSVAFTYNDPVVFLEYAVDVAVACRALDIRTVAVTAGYLLAEGREDLFSAMDAANVDLKAFSESFYRRLCGGHLEPVKETLVWLARRGAPWLEITTLLIPGENDSPAEIARLAEWIAVTLGPDVPLHLSAFHPDGRMRDHPPTDPRALSAARQVARAAGLRHVYTGNVVDPEGGSTRCPECGAMLIGRDRYRLIAWGVDDEGRCAQCGAVLAGRFESRPGAWGARRQPVRLGG